MRGRILPENTRMVVHRGASGGNCDVGKRGWGGSSLGQVKRRGGRGKNSVAPQVVIGQYGL